MITHKERENTMKKVMTQKLIPAVLFGVVSLSNSHGMDEQHNEFKRGPAPAELTRAKAQGPIQTINIGGPAQMIRPMPEGGFSYAGEDMSDSDEIIPMPEGGLSYAGADITDSDEESEFENILKLANTGNPAAMDIIGYKYEKGRGVEKNLFLAKMWYEKALSNGNEAPRKAYTRVCNKIAKLAGGNDAPQTFIEEPFHVSGPTLQELHAANPTPLRPDYQDETKIVFNLSKSNLDLK